MSQNHSDRPSAPKNSFSLSRRAVLASGAGLAAGLGLGCSVRAADSAAQSPEAIPGNNAFKIANGRINQSVVFWCFQDLLSYDKLAAMALQLGLKSVELADPKYWPTLKKYGLACAMSPSHKFTQGFAHKEEHAECIDMLRKRIDQAADFGCPSVITFSGMRRGISDEKGISNMIDGLKQIVGYAEKKNITICLEMLNSRVHVTMKGHPDYFCDNIERSIDVIRGVGSPRMKLLFDIYHVQIMEGDVITRIRQFNEYIGHYHTAGVPGRNELDNSQEINYPPIMEAIVATGYKGYVGQEFIPAHATPLAGLAQAARVCDV
jgi:hydroxypyruvate isomerase